MIELQSCRTWTLHRSITRLEEGSALLQGCQLGGICRSRSAAGCRAGCPRAVSAGSCCNCVCTLLQLLVHGPLLQQDVLQQL